ncbi:MAG: hypothetical protein HYY29_00845 [Chloroflexi bacterium]|nr:hypothetical protein [Chloroflexota bacterium]
MGTNPTDDLHPVNAASVRLDDTGGDKVTIADALFIAQRLAGLRDAGFNAL